jgi:DNA-binding response OmpR family regulator
MRILIVEDNSSIRNVLRISLESECFVVDEAEDGDHGSFLARTNDYDIVILDNVLPKKMGKEVCEDIREAGKTMPVLILSMKSDVLEKINLLDAGADDYLTKPFSFAELLARIRSLTRRPRQIETNVLAIKDITLDKDKHEASKGGKNLNLTKKEFALLEILLKNKEKVVSRGQILEHVWDFNADPFSNTIEAHILSLRKKLEDKRRNLIRNIPGRGYKITETCL